MSLKYRIALVIFILEAIMLSVVLGVTLTQTQNITQEQQSQTHDTILSLVSEIASVALLTEEYADIQFHFEYLQKDPMITKVLLIDENNQTVVATDVNVIGKNSPPLINGKSTFWKTKDINTAAGPLGTLAVQFSNIPLQESFSETRNLSISIAITGMGIILVVGIAVGFALTRRLEVVTRAAKDMAKGNLDTVSNISGGDELGLLGTSFDNMAKSIKQSQTKLTSQLKRNRLILDTTNDGFCLLNLSGKIIETNAAFNKMLPVSKSDTTKDFAEFPFTNPQLVQELISRTVERGYVRFETTINLNESVQFIDIAFKRLDDDNESLIFGFLRDITEIRLAEQELKRYNYQLEALVEARTAALEEKAQIIEQTHESVISTSIDGGIRTWNKGAEQLFGYSSAEIIGEPIASIFPDSSHINIPQMLSNITTDNSLNNPEIELIKKNGKTFYGHVSLSRLVSKNKENDGFTLFIIDITARKQAENLLRQRSHELELLNKELESFSYSVSHDLRAPLRSIDGFSQALYEDYRDAMDETGNDYLSRIRRSAQKMGHLIDDLLQLSRVTRSDLVRSETNLSNIAEEITNELKQREPSRNVEVEISPNMKANCDARLIRIVLDNLLGNAWKYTGKKEQAHISFRQEMQNGEKVFVVTDNGAGFDMRYSHKLFGAFQRLHRPEEFEGTGVGLATVNRIIHRHGGKIWTQATVDQGANFYFVL